jgi:hypothetical protein
MLVDNIFKKLYVPVFIYIEPNTPVSEDGFGSKEISDDSISYAYYYAVEFLHNIDDNTRANKVQDDSIRYFLCSSTVKLPDKDYYLYYRNKNKNIESIKLNKITDPSNKSKYNCTIWMEFDEVNADTTKIKIEAGYGLYNESRKVITNTDTFDVQNCKWIVLDSTLWEY